MATYTDNYNLTKPTFAESADIRTINGNMDTIDDVLHASQVSLADAYDETRTSSNPYNTGDIVMYELLMYKCLEDGVYGTWDGTKWERTTAGANGGGSDVEVTPSYNSGTKIAEIDVDGTTSNIYVPAMTGASSGSDGASGLVPTPQDGDEDKYLKGNGQWATVSGGTDYVELTQAEYDALSPAEKINGKMYFVTDGNADTASGRSGYSETVIYENTGSTQASSMTLTDDIAKYDLILFEAYVYSDNRLYTMSNIYRASTIISGWSATLVRWSPAEQYVNFGYVSGTELTCYSSSNMYIKRIVGLKYIGGSSGGSSEGINYSTEEQDTGIKWIDGKSIYQKTFSFSDGDYQLQRNSWTAISSVSIPTLENVVDIRMIGYDTANKYPAVEDGCFKRFINGILNYYLDKDFPIYLRAVTVQYTKSST